MAATFSTRRAPQPTSQADGLAFDPADPGFHADPYPLYARLREEAAVHRTRTPDPAWVVTRYADCLSLLRDRRVGALSGFSLHTAVRGARGPGLERRGAEAELQSRHLARAVSPWTLQRLRPRLEATVDCLVASLDECEEADLLARLAEPVAVAAVCELLEVPVGDRSRYRHWLAALAAGVAADPSDRSDSQAARQACAGHLAAQIEADDRSPAGGLFTSLALPDGGARLDGPDRVALGVQIALAGYLMSRGLVANTLLALLRHRPAEIALRADPGLAGFVVEECQRWDPPLQLAVRVALEDFALHGHPVQAGDNLWLLVAAANRDPRSFLDPDRFDPTRAGPPCLGSGPGGPFGLGAELGRMAAEVVVRRLAAGEGRMMLAAEQLDRVPSALFRAPGRIPVALARG